MFRYQRARKIKSYILREHVILVLSLIDIKNLTLFIKKHFCTEKNIELKYYKFNSIFPSIQYISTVFEEEISIHRIAILILHVTTGKLAQSIDSYNNIRTKNYQFSFREYKNVPNRL